MAVINPLDVSTYDIAELRRLAAAMKITAEKTWTKDEYITAINTRRKREVAAKIVLDSKQEIPVGFVRIKLPLTQEGSDSPLTIRVNNFVTTLPRDVVVDVPKEVRDQLASTTESVTRKVFDKDGHETIKAIEVPCQPFTQIGESYGESGAVRPMNSHKDQRVRELYRKVHEKWPRRTDPDWVEFRKAFVAEHSAKEAKKASDASDREEAEAA